MTATLQTAAPPVATRPIPAATPAAPAPPAATERDSLGRAALILSAGTLVASAANYLLNLILARWMSPAEFGDANLIVTLMLAITAIAVTWQLVAARRTSLDDPTGAHVASIRVSMTRRAWMVGGALGVALAAASPALRDLTSSASALPFVLLAVGLMFYLVQAVERGVLQGRLRFGALAATLLAEAGVRLAVGIGLVALGFGVSGATLGITASFVVSWALAARLVRRSDGVATTAGSTVAPSVRRSAADRIAAQAAGLLLVGQIIVNNGDVVLAKILFDADDAGVHSVVALIGRAIFFLSWSVVTAAFPLAASASGDAGQAIERRAMTMVAAIAGALTLVIGALGPVATPLVLGAGYERAGSLFLPYALATSLFVVANVKATLAVAHGRRRPALIVIVAGVGQAMLLAGAADGLIMMSWLQVVAMATLLVAVVIESRVDGVRDRSV